MSTLERDVLVTGASRGIGLAVGRAFAEAGARAWLCARPSEALTTAVTELADTKGDARALPGDLARDAAESVLGPLIEHGRLDVLVHNVGDVGPFAGFEQTADADWRDSLEVNLMAAVRVTRQSLPLLRAAPRAGIIFIGSAGATRPTGKWPHYTAAKAALLNFAQSLALELAPEGIVVNTVAPGPVWTHSWEREAAEQAAREGTTVREAGKKLERAAAEGVPLGRIGRAEDVAALCVFLASPQAGWITGAEIPVNGGGAV